MAPGKPPCRRRRFWIDQARPASTGDVSGRCRGHTGTGPPRAAANRARRARSARLRPRPPARPTAGAFRPGPKFHSRPRRYSPSATHAHRCRRWSWRGLHECHGGGAQAHGGPAPRRLSGPCSASRARSSARVSSTPAGRRAAMMRGSRLLAGGVDDEVEARQARRVGGPRHHQVIDDAALLVEQLRVALLARLQSEDVRWNESLQRRRHAVVVATPPGSPGPYARRRTARPRRGYAHVRPGCPCGTAPAWNSRRMAPCAPPSAR